MNYLIAGGTGFIGQALVKSLLPEHEVTVIGRNQAAIRAIFGQAVHASSWDHLQDLEAKQYDVVMNLSGENIAASRWNEEVKEKIIQSRVQTTQQLVKWLIQAQHKPRFYSANAVGIYGVQTNGDLHAFDEDSAIHFEKPTDFLSEVGVRWQQALKPAIDFGMPVVIMRFGVVLKKGEGMLKKLAPSFSLGFGSIIGNGQQVISWIHLDDVISAIHFLIDRPDLTGAYNLTSPNPVSQKEFAKTLAKVLHRPLFLKMPSWVVKLLLGEMGDYLINRGQRVLPKRLSALGFKFEYPLLIGALQAEFPAP